MKKHLIVLALITAGILGSITAQEGVTYYVPGPFLNLRTGPSTDTEILTKLQQYSNVEYLEEDGDWVKVKYDGKDGYVFKSYIKEGKAVVNSFQYRVGATCRDGSSSSATGRGACSHHGGVSSWRYKTERSVSIE